MKPKSSLRFDPREIAVLFSLFVFVSLLMFTVGIMVGKGLTQARFEGSGGGHAPEGLHDPLVKAPEPHAGSSVSMGHATQVNAAEHGASDHAAAAPAHGKEAAPAEHAAEGHTAAPAQTAQSKPAEKIKLVPLTPPPPEKAGVALSEQSTKEAEQLLKNPRILSLLEDDEPAAKKPRTPSSSATAPSGGAGSFTVQVGSYPNETAAKERVETLKKLGFTGAFFSAKELGASSGTWYRVWLGQYSDFDAAKKVGDQLQAKGEVKNYIVRKN